MRFPDLMKRIRGNRRRNRRNSREKDRALLLLIENNKKKKKTKRKGRGLLMITPQKDQTYMMLKRIGRNRMRMTMKRKGKRKIENCRSEGREKERGLSLIIRDQRG